MYPVMDGIPMFVSPQSQTWPPLTVTELREKKWIERNWRDAGEEMLKEKSRLTEFAARIAESEGLILDVASGPAGGFVPKILHMNPEARVLRNDLGLGVLLERRRFLKEIKVPNVSFALFDATRMPLKSDSIDTVSERGGFDNIPRGAEAVRESHRILETGGTLFPVNSVAEENSVSMLSS